MRKLSFLLVLAASAVGAQQPVWTGTVTTMAEPFVGSGPLPSTWLWEDAGIRRAVGHTSIGVDGIAARRFGLWDGAGAVELYTPTSAKSYINLRAQLAPGAQVLPSTDLSGEFFQSFANGWEGSLGARHMQFDSAGTTIGTLGVGRSFGNNYVRGRWIALLRSAGGIVSAGALTARRYGASADNYIEGGYTAGSEVVSVGSNQAYDIRATNAAYVRGQRFLDARHGIAGLLSYSKDARIPARAGVSVSAMVRW